MRRCGYPFAPGYLSHMGYGRLRHMKARLMIRERMLEARMSANKLEIHVGEGFDALAGRMPEPSLPAPRRSGHPLPLAGPGAGFHRRNLRHVRRLDLLVPRRRFRQEVVDVGCRRLSQRRARTGGAGGDRALPLRHTGFRIDRAGPDHKPAIQELYARLAADPARNQMIFNDVLLTLEAGRSPVVITERKDHLAQYAVTRPGAAVAEALNAAGIWGSHAPAILAARVARLSREGRRRVILACRQLGGHLAKALLDEMVGDADQRQRVR